MPFTEDFTLFIDTDDFATAITVDGDPVDAIFESTWVEVTIGNTPYSGEYPTLMGDESDFTGHIGDTVVVNTVSYTIIDIRPDGVGMALVILMEQ